VKRHRLFLVVSTLVCAPVLATGALAQGRGGGAAAPAESLRAVSPRAAAPIDMTGQWVAVISEDWRWRMITPPKGDIVSIPLNLQGQKAAESWDPAKDEAAREQCKAYGAPGLMRGPIRMRISWQDDTTLKLDTDYGMQTRLFRFGNATTPAGPRSWQGHSTAEWSVRGGGRGGPRYGSLKTVTTNLRPGYLRKNGVPYSENAVLTEHWDLYKRQNGEVWLTITTQVEDPQYLPNVRLVAPLFKRERDGSKWDPTPCSARW